MRRFRCDGSLSGTPIIFRKGLGLESKMCCSLFILDPRINPHLLSYEPHNEGQAHSEKLIVHYEGT